MNHRRSAGLLLSLNLLQVGAPTALAHEISPPTPAPGVALLNEQEQYKLALEHFRFDTNLFKRISKTFTTAVNKANSVYEAAMRRAPSDRARMNHAARRDSSVEIAIKIRDDAIAQLGGAPVEPTKPVKPMASTVTKKTKASNPSPTPSP